MHATEFMEQLERDIHAHPFLTRNPLVRSLGAGTPLSREQGRRFALYYYPHIMRTRLYQANALGIAGDERVQYVLAMILYDEYGEGNRDAAHPEVYRRFMRAAGVSEAAIQSGGVILPELELYISQMMRLSQLGDWLAAAACVGIACEWPIPEMYRRFLVGLRTLPGINEADLELFTGHIVLDEDHSAMMREALMPYAETADGQTRIREGVRVNLDARHVFMTGLHRAVFEEEEQDAGVSEGLIRTA